jgi:hypothetical protein
MMQLERRMTGRGITGPGITGSGTPGRGTPGRGTSGRGTSGPNLPITFRRCRQNGQALVFGLCLLLLVALLIFFQFSAGQVSAAKLRIVNATDAAAYSVGIWRARAMNYYAYSNRAIIANEVAIAQAATMVSYGKYLERLTDNVDDVAQYIPYVGQVSEALKEVAYWVSQVTQVTAEGETAARSLYLHALAASQELMFAATHPVVLSRIAAEVARENDRRFFAFTLPMNLDAAFGDLTARYEGADRDRLKSVVLESLDGFSTDRDADLVEIPCLSKLARRGATELIRDHDTGELERWQAYDTLSLHTRRTFSCGMRERVPLGWGAAEVAKDSKNQLDALSALAPLIGNGDVPTGADVSSNVPSASKRTNPRAYDEASGEIWVSNQYQGIASVRELDFRDHPTVMANSRYPVMKVAVVGWVQSGEAVGTASAKGLAAGRVLPVDRFSDRASAVMGAVSAAEVYFRRPPQALQRIEYASLYSPYWQVRLGPVPPAWRQAAAGYFQ